MHRLSSLFPRPKGFILFRLVARKGRTSKSWASTRTARGIKAALRANGALTARRSGGEVEGLQVELVAEPDNPYDSNALSVRWNGCVLGYLSREDAARYTTSQENYFQWVRRGRRCSSLGLRQGGTGFAPASPSHCLNRDSWLGSTRSPAA